MDEPDGEEITVTIDESAKSISVSAGATGIEKTIEQRAKSKDIYDLTGRRIEAITAPGIYILNGKKYIRK